MVQIEEELEGGVLQEGGSPGGWDLDGAEVVRGLVSRGPDEVEGEAVVGEPQQLGHEAVLGAVVEVEVGLVVQRRPQQGRAQLEDLEELRVSEAGGYFPVLGQAAAGISLRYLIHLENTFQYIMVKGTIAICVRSLGIHIR